MKGLIQLKKVLNSKGKQEINTVRTLYMVMQKVGGYEQLMNLSVGTLNEITKCMEWEVKEQNKPAKGGKR